MVPHTMKPEVVPLCRGWMHYGRWCSPGLRRTHARLSLAKGQNLLSSLKTTERHSNLQSTLSRHLSSCAWRCRGVSDSLARGTRDLSSSANRRFPMALSYTACATWARISYLDAVRATTAARIMRRSWHVSAIHGRPEPSLRVWDHCWKQRHTNVILCPICTAICRYVHVASRSNGWSCSSGVHTRWRGMVVPYNECCKHCSRW